MDPVGILLHFNSQCDFPLCCQSHKFRSHNFIDLRFFDKTLWINFEFRQNNINYFFVGSTSGQCNNRLSSQFSRYCGFYLGLTNLGTANQPICGKMHIVHILFWLDWSLSFQVFFYNRLPKYECFLCKIVRLHLLSTSTPMLPRISEPEPHQPVEVILFHRSTDNSNKFATFFILALISCYRCYIARTNIKISFFFLWAWRY